MRFLVLATDYDRTLAEDGHVPDRVWTAIRQLRESGRRVILVTGRELEDLQVICPHLDLFDRVVAEDGALIHDPHTKEVRELAELPPPRFAASLRSLGVAPLSVGHVIVATVRPYETAVLNVISELGLEMQVIFNQEAVMVLPSGVNKATGLMVALKELGLSPHNVVAIGDAENDHALLTACECGVAVANGVPALRERADLVMNGIAGDGVIELIDLLIADDLQESMSRVNRHDIKFGVARDGREETLPAFGTNVMFTGTSGSGKSIACAALLERLGDAGYQFAIIDPEGDYADIPGVATIGSAERSPQLDEIRHLLVQGDNACINLLGMPTDDRPAFADRLLRDLLDSRERTGRPHWIVVDEAHHLMPRDWTPAAGVENSLRNLILITVHPGSVSPIALSAIDLVLAMGTHPTRTITEFCTGRGIPNPAASPDDLRGGEAIAFWTNGSRPPFKMMTPVPRAVQQQHRRRYAEGRLPDRETFIFSGPEGKLQLRAYNLVVFLELASGVDDATWLYHLRRGEYSKWIRQAIHDDELANYVSKIETSVQDAVASREAIKKEIDARYTLAATGATSSN